MSDKVRWKRALKQAAAVGLILCLAVCLLVGGFVLVNHNHMGRLFTIVSYIETQYLEKPTAEQLVDGAINGMVSSLDKYSSFQNAEENKTLMSSIKGEFGGIGVYLSTADPEELVVTRPIKDSPAEKAGVEAGDVIVKIDDTDVASISQDEAVAILRGDSGTKVTVKLYRSKTNEEYSVILTREIISVPTVEGTTLPGYPDIALIDISSFSMQTGDELEQTLKNLNMDNYKGVIIDLRYNCGGEVNAAIKTASLLVPEGAIVHIVDKNGKVDTKESTAQFMNKPFVMLINEYSASASEIVAGAVKDYGSGTIVGTTSFGKGVVQTVFPLDDYTSVKLTTNKYLTPLKKDINKKGIEPDVVVELKEGEKPTIMPSSQEFDSQLQKALDVLNAKIK
ncbi:MAG: S41 family peptidase [Eubacteriales bacterium]